MENINNTTNEILSNVNSKIILLNGVKLLVFESGTIYRFSSKDKLKLVINSANQSKGYNRFGINGKHILQILNYKLIILTETKLIIISIIYELLINNKINGIGQRQKVIRLIKKLINIELKLDSMVKELI